MINRTIDRSIRCEPYGALCDALGCRDPAFPVTFKSLSVIDVSRVNGIILSNLFVLWYYPRG